MGFINRWYMTPGKGVEKDAPRKTGAARFVELTLRHGGRFIGNNLLVCLTAAPGTVAAVLGLVTGQAWLVLGGGAMAGLMAGPWIVVLEDVLLRAMREEAGFWWHNCRKALAASGKAALLPGTLFGLATAAQLATLQAMLAGQGNTLGYALLFLGLLAAAMVQLWFWPQLALMELPFLTLLKNSLLLALAYPQRSIPAALLTLLYWGLMLGFLPLTVLLFLLLGFWYITLTGLLFIYSVLDENFHIEEEVRRKREGKNE